MNKAVVKMVILLFVVAILTIACGSNSKKNVDTKSKNSFDFKNRDERKSSDKDDASYSPLTKEEYDSAVKKVYEKSKEECAPIEEAYANFSAPGQSDPNADEIFELKNSINNYGGYVEDFFNDSSWPAMYYEDDDDTPTDKLQEKVKNLRKISVDASEKFPTPAEYSTYDIESSTQLEKLHLATAEFVKNVNSAGFGPCKI